MAQYVTPPKKSAQQIAGANLYACPLCTVQTTSGKTDIGWVLCPMLDNKALCYGCCIDYQGVASSEDFEQHPFLDLFNDAAKLTGKSSTELQEICLQHQQDIIRSHVENNN